MKRFPVTSTALICASLLALSACGAQDATTTAAPPSASAPTAETSATAGEPPATGGTSEKQLCAGVKKAGDDSKAALAVLVSSGAEPTAADFQKILVDMNKTLTSLASDAEKSKVTAAIEDIAAEAEKASKAADPAGAAANPAFEKAGADITAACKAAGVDVNF